MRRENEFQAYGKMKLTQMRMHLYNELKKKQKCETDRGGGRASRV
jgi:hypothetical protein